MFRDDMSALQSYDGIAISRAETEDVPVQVMLDDGFFHREMDYKTTACDLPIPALGQWRRSNKYEGNLSPDCGCWTAKEVARAREANEAERKIVTGEIERVTPDLPEAVQPIRPRKPTR